MAQEHCPAVCTAASARAHTQKLSHSRVLGGWQGRRSALDLLLGITLSMSSPLASLFFPFLCLSIPSYCLLRYFSFAIPLSIRGDVTLIWHYSHPPSFPPSLFSHPSSPSHCHPFYCKPCDWQLQLQVLQQAFASAVWLCKDPTLPPAYTPIRPTGLPLATGFKSGQKKTPRSFGGAATLLHSLCK